MHGAIIMDLDGTLVDSVDLHAECWQKAFQHYGFDLPYEAIRNRIGMGGDHLIPALLPAADAEKLQEGLSHYRDKLFKSDFIGRVKPFPKVRELFERCRAEGWRVALASSGRDEEIEHYVGLTHIGGLYDAFTTFDDAKHSKPSPDIILAALKKLGSPQAGLCITVGDTPYDAEASGKAGVRAVGVRCGGFGDQVLREAGCEALFDGPADLLARFEESPLRRGMV